MAEANNNETFNEADAQLLPQGAEIEEVLLADLTGKEHADLIFEGLVDRDTGMGRTLEQLRTTTNSNAHITGGDIDDNLYQAEVVGEEAVGGQTPTPDQSVTEELLQAMGISSTDGELVQTKEKLEKRDHQRWELDPESSEDYQEHSDQKVHSRSKVDLHECSPPNPTDVGGVSDSVDPFSTQEKADYYNRKAASSPSMRTFAAILP